MDRNEKVDIEIEVRNKKKLWEKPIITSIISLDLTHYGEDFGNDYLTGATS